MQLAVGQISSMIQQHSPETAPLPATQPVNAGLLKNTIETQDAAFQLSSGNAVKRSTKISQLAMQVDARVSRVVHSGEEKMKVLEDQRTRREASVKVEGKGWSLDKFSVSLARSLTHALLYLFKTLI